jgi:hypothetical protein
MIGIAGLTIEVKPLQELLLTFQQEEYDQIRQSVAYSEKKCENLCFTPD